MQQLKEKSKKAFRDFILNVPMKDYQRIKNAIIEQCYINYYTFKRWEKGIQPIPIIYFEKINKIAGREILKIENDEIK